LNQASKLLFIFFTLIVFTGCQWENPFKPSKEEMALKNKTLEAKIEQENQQLQTKKEIELAKINTDLQKEKLQLQNQTKQNDYELQKLQYTHRASLEAYYLLLYGFIALLVAVGIYMYAHYRRKDKLKAYEDNLKKYFQTKENEAKKQVAYKIIDTIATGKLNPQQEARLLSSFNQDSKQMQELLEKSEEEPIMELEIIEDKSKKKKKKKKTKKEK
jgi:hypothetical protein